MKRPSTISQPLLAVILISSPMANANDPQAVGNACAKMYPGGPSEKITECIMLHLKSGNKIAVPDNQPIPNQPRDMTTKKYTPQKNSGDDKSNTLDDNTTDPTKGCPYLFITNYGLTHEKGIKGCLGEKSMICEIKGKNSKGEFIYGWHVASNNSCIPGYRDLKRIEQNSEAIHKTKDNLKDMGD